jgi:riboflavin kinase/FMN adenylyltransferase
MKIHTDLTLVNQIRRPIVTIGSFDGVHLGHREILKHLVSYAQKVDGSSVVITFHPHPRQILHPDAPPVKLLHNSEEKASHLENIGIDHLVVVPFTTDFAELTAEAYVTDFLIHLFKPHTIIVGYDHQFGKGRTGNFTLLEQYARQGFFQLMEIPQQLLESVAISSTQIRKRLISGELESANALLGYEYTISGSVQAGTQTGRKLGFPTANLLVSDAFKLIPAKGVYAVWAIIHARRHQAMLNIGNRPTFGEHDTSIEVHIIDFDGDLYGESIRIDFVARLRDEQQFSGIDDLIEQLNKDRDSVKHRLSQQ